MTAQPPTLWHTTARLHPNFGTAEGALECDLLVIGGGFTGLSTALHAAQFGQKIILLEAQQIAWGATGRNAGFVVPNFAKVDPAAERPADRVQRRFAATRPNQLWVSDFSVPQ